MTETMRLITLYGTIINCPVKYEYSEWYYDFVFNGNCARHRLWVAKTHTNYDYETYEDLIAALKIKILLHWSTAGLRDRIRVGVER